MDKVDAVERSIKILEWAIKNKISLKEAESSLP
jgi:hypothetical protein